MGQDDRERGRTGTVAANWSHHQALEKMRYVGSKCQQHLFLLKRAFPKRMGRAISEIAQIITLQACTCVELDAKAGVQTASRSSTTLEAKDLTEKTALNSIPSTLHMGM